MALFKDPKPSDVSLVRGVMRGGNVRTLDKGDTKPSAPTAPEVDPLESFKKSNAYRRLTEIGAIDSKCKLLNPYFRAQTINRDGTYYFNSVYKIHEPFNNLRVLLTYWGGSEDITTNRGHNNGTLWDMILLKSNETEYKNNHKDGN